MGKRILILGNAGYIGWQLTKHLVSRGDIVWGLDSFLRDRLVRESGSDSIIPILPVEKRKTILNNLGFDFTFTKGDIVDYGTTYSIISQFNPDTIIHLAEIASAPFSLESIKTATLTQHNNVIGTLNLLFAIRDINPNIHLIKLATMGELGTPKIPITEGYIEIEYKRKKDLFPFPKQPFSFYHISKSQDTLNIEFACKAWKLNCTNIFQGVLFGTQIKSLNHPGLETRFDVCPTWGTAINRMCAQAVIEHPLTVYGKGGQTRGFLPLRDSIQCLALLADNPAQGYRIVNQMAETHRIIDLAHTIQRIAWGEYQLRPEVVHLENPRIEKEEHFYEVERKILSELGYKPSITLEDEIRLVIQDLIPYKDRIKKLEHLLIPTTQWSGKKRKSETIQKE